MRTKFRTRLVLVSAAAVVGGGLGYALGDSVASKLGGMFDVANWPILAGVAFSFVCGLCAYGVVRWRGR